MISSKEDLAASAREVGTLLQEIQDYLGSRSDDSGKVSFPKGFIRSRNSIASTLPVTKSPKHRHALSKNICYTLIEADVLKWLLTRTHLGLVAKPMVIKEVMCLLGDVCDSLMVDALYRKHGPKKSYKQRTKKLSELGIITAELHEALDWLWDQRSRVHLWQLGESEYDHDRYGDAQYERAHRTYEQLIAALKASDN
ncbi:MAG: hypothetical protein QM570_04210 [Planctomycetota bacterium]|jgi:hypothetical protein|nr:hypothetical protein [Planctomycetota bacterium]